MIEQLKLAIIGAGSTYTPELIDGLIRFRQELPITEVFLMDIDRVKLGILGAIFNDKQEEHNLLVFRKTFIF